MSSYRGGGGGRSSGGRSRGRGRGRGSSHDNNSSNKPSIASSAKLRPCRNFTATGNCDKGNSCHFAHVVRLHGSVDASSSTNNGNSNNGGGYHNNNSYNNNYNQVATTSAVAVWETQGAIKIFTGSHDKFWRLWNTNGGNFAKEFEHNMQGSVECLQVVNNFLFCGFEAASRALPDVPVGMVHVWNLQQPSQPPLELCSNPVNLIPYAHHQAVTALCIETDANGVPTVISGSRDGAIKVWTFDTAKNQFVLEHSLEGHAREVTGLVYITANKFLWSSSTDGSLRIWDLNQGGICQHIIVGSAAAAAAGGAPAVGHTNAVTSLLSFGSAAGAFLLSASLDGTIKAWNGATGECVASEDHDEGVVTMSLAKDAANHELLLVGMESGNIICRNLVQTPKSPAFQLLFALSAKYQVAHNGPVKSIVSGPAATFYSVGGDGKLNVWQFTGDLGI